MILSDIETKAIRWHFPFVWALVSAFGLFVGANVAKFLIGPSPVGFENLDRAVYAGFFGMIQGGWLGIVQWSQLPEK